MAEWRLEGDRLLVTPKGGTPLPFRLQEVSGISGDGYAIKLRVNGEILCLERLGGEGPTLLESLKRLWLPIRSNVLRLTGEGNARPFTGSVVSGAGASPFHGVLHDEVFLYATEGSDIHALFIASIAEAQLDEQTFTVQCTSWDGARVVFGKLAGRTAEFSDQLSAARSRLANRGSDTLNRHISTIEPLARTELAGIWLPGRVMALAEIEKLCHGFISAFQSTWLALLPRKSEAEILLKMVESDHAFLGLGRPFVEGTESPSNDDEYILWLLISCRKGWLLESLSEKDHATYRFEAGPEMPALVSGMLCSSRLRWESIFMPLEEFTGERADLAIPCRDLPFIRDLRQRFKGRIIHTSLESWQREIQG